MCSQATTISELHPTEEVPYFIIENVLNYLPLKQAALLLLRMNKKWRKQFFTRYFNSYRTFSKIYSTKYKYDELKFLFKIGKQMIHLKALESILREDFGGQHKFFSKNMALMGKVAPNLFKPVSTTLSESTGRLKQRNKGRLFESFKIKSKHQNS